MKDALDLLQAEKLGLTEGGGRNARRGGTLKRPSILTQLAAGGQRGCVKVRQSEHTETAMPTSESSVQAKKWVPSGGCEQLLLSLARRSTSEIEGSQN